MTDSLRRLGYPAGRGHVQWLTEANTSMQAAAERRVLDTAESLLYPQTCQDHSDCRLVGAWARYSRSPFVVMLFVC